MPAEDFDVYIAIQVWSAQAERSLEKVDFCEIALIAKSISRSNLFLIFNFC